VYCVGLDLVAHESAQQFPTRVPNLPDNIVSISSGNQHTMILTSDGLVLSFGNNDDGQLGREGLENVPSSVQGLEELDIKQIVCGDSITAFLTAKGDVFCCGTFRDHSGQTHFSPGIKNCSIPTLQTEFKVPVVHLAAGNNRLLAVDEKGVIYKWGYGTLESYREGAKNQLVPTKVTVVKEVQVDWRVVFKKVLFKKVFAGSEQFFALDDEGRVWAFGANYWYKSFITLPLISFTRGQLGVGDMEYKAHPTLVASLRSHIIVEVSSGTHHTLFLTSKGIVYAGGGNEYSQLGFGARLRQTFVTPFCANTLNNIVSISSGMDHNAVLDRNGTMYCWGWGEECQLANGLRANEHKEIRKLESKEGDWSRRVYWNY
jgi:regulator of chromosome condensation